MATSTCDLSDRFADEARVLPPMFRDFGGRRRFTGAAITVKCFEDNSRVKELLGTAGHGRVLVVDGGGSTRCALLGDMIGKDAVDNGWEGVVVYGSVRDAALLATLNLGVKALACRTSEVHAARRRQRWPLSRHRGRHGARGRRHRRGRRWAYRSDG